MPLLNGGHFIWIVLLVGVLIIFGPKRLPELGSSFGRALREFRHATSEVKEQLTQPLESPAEPDKTAN